MEFLTIQQTIKRFPISEDLLYELAPTDGFPAVKVKGRWIIAFDDLIVWFRRQYADKSAKETPCHTADQIRATGGLLSAEYAKALGLTTARTRQPLKRD